MSTFSQLVARVVAALHSSSPSDLWDACGVQSRRVLRQDGITAPAASLWEPVARAAYAELTYPSEAPQQNP